MDNETVEEQTSVKTNETVINEDSGKNKIAETIEDTGKISANESEYDTVEETDEEQDTKEKARSTYSDNNSHRSGDSSESETDIVLEREEGDGQESAPTKKVDDDEDKKNPQYIPKRGTFYEHDDRTADDVENVEVVEPEKDNKKKVWQDKKERWSHDKYNDNEQAPKSKSELVSIYGYDIRNEDGPPRARRRRRYGRGPNKYTRNWEDEDAYTSKPPISRPKKPLRKPRSEEEEFPPLGNTSDGGSPTNGRVDQAANLPPKEQLKQPPQDWVGSSKQEDYNPAANETSSSKQELKHHLNSAPQNDNQNGKVVQQRAGTGRVFKGKKEIKDSDYKGFTKSRQYKSSKTEQKVLPRRSVKTESDYIQSQNYTNKRSTQDVEADFAKLSMQDAGHRNSTKHGGPRQASVPPRLQAEQKASKRYSSLRQRSLPETAAPPFSQHQSNYYANEYNQQNQATQQAGILHQNNSIHPSTQVPQIPPPPIATIPQQVPTVSATPILQAPPQYVAPFGQAPPPFLQANVAPPAFLPQQAPQIINYVQGQAQFPQAPFQGFQQPFTPVNQPAELYQPQGGITYYSPQEQQVAQRAAPLKRPKAAIPIVPPPPEPRGRGRGLLTQPEILNSNSENVIENSNQFEDAAVTE